MSNQDPSRFLESKYQTEANRDYRARLERYFGSSIGSTAEKLANFAKYAPRQKLSKFLSRYEIFKKVLQVQGSIVECGVLFGGGLMTWAQLSNILEPVNYQRTVIGFDTFTGFSGVSKEDQTSTSEFLYPGGLELPSYEDLLECIELYDTNRFLNHIPKIQLVKGDATSTIPNFLQSNPQLVVSLLNLDFDLFGPTKAAIGHFVPRMPKGAIIVFDELNSELWPGETVAVLETVGIRNLRIERSAFDSCISFAVFE